MDDDDADAESQPQTAAVTPPLATISSPATTFPATQVSPFFYLIFLKFFLNMLSFEDLLGKLFNSISINNN